MELIYACNCAVTKMLEKKNIPLPEPPTHYLNKENLNRIIYHEHSEDNAVYYAKALEDTLAVLAVIREELAGEEAVRLLSRMLEEQTVADENGNLTFYRHGRNQLHGVFGW